MIRYFLALAAGLILAPSTFAQLTFEFEGVERSYFMEAPDPHPRGCPTCLCAPWLLEQFNLDSSLQRMASHG